MVAHRNSSDNIDCCFCLALLPSLTYLKQCRETSEFATEPGKKFAEFHTYHNDELLNSHNPGFILWWRTNIDFRPVINKDAVIAYVAKYAK